MIARTQKILVVEDDQPLLLVLVDKLTSEGFTVLPAKDGEEGLASALRDHPDLILLDIVMPRLDGLSMLKQLRADEWGKKVAVIVLTNLSDLEKVSEVIAQGSNEYLIKSDHKLEEIVAKVRAKLA